MHLNLNYTNVGLYCEIENSYLNVNLVRGNLLTTKKDKKGHGLGLESVKKVLSKYNGVLQINCDKGGFIVEAVFIFADRIKRGFDFVDLGIDLGHFITI